MTIKEAQEKVDNWISTYGRRYFDEKTNTLVLMEEVGEFARIVARKYGEQSFKETISEIEIEEQLKEELADVLFVLICLANQMNFDLETILQQSLIKKTNRDSQRHIGNEKLLKE